MIWRAYRYVISPMIHVLCGPGFGCRFEPTCSRYAEDALRLYGPIRGGSLAMRRVLKCHPWGGQGFDPVTRNQNG